MAGARTMPRGDTHVGSGSPGLSTSLPGRLHVLVLAEALPPLPDPAAGRVDRLVVGLADAGHQVTVLVPPTPVAVLESTAADVSPETGTDGRVTVELVGWSDPSLSGRIQDYDPLAGTLPEVHAAVVDWTTSRVYPDLAAPWAPRAAARARAVHRRTPVDVVVAAGTDHAVPLAAFLAAVALRRPLLVDDAADELAGVLSAHAPSALLRRILRTARQVSVAAPARAAQVARLGRLDPDRVVSLPTPPGRAPGGTGGGAERALTVAVPGPFSPAVRLRDLVAAWRIARTRQDLFDAELLLAGPVLVTDPHRHRTDESERALERVHRHTAGALARLARAHEGVGWVDRTVSALDAGRLAGWDVVVLPPRSDRSWVPLLPDLVASRAALVTVDADDAVRSLLADRACWFDARSTSPEDLVPALLRASRAARTWPSVEPAQPSGALDGAAGADGPAGPVGPAVAAADARFAAFATALLTPVTAR